LIEKNSKEINRQKKLTDKKIKKQRTLTKENQPESYVAGRILQAPSSKVA
jgi:hypothetical protein